MAEVKRLTGELIQQITAEEYKKTVLHVMSEINYRRNRDLDNTVHDLITQLDENSSRSEDETVRAVTTMRKDLPATAHSTKVNTIVCVCFINQIVLT